MEVFKFPKKSYYLTQGFGVILFHIEIEKQ